MSAADEDPKPSPSDLEAFLPWLCKQLQLSFQMQIERLLQRDFVSGLTSEYGKPQKNQRQVSTHSYPNNYGSDHTKVSSMSGDDNQNTLINLALIFDQSDNLVGLKLERNRKVPSEVIKLFGLIIPFHPHLTSLTITTGLNALVIYELCTILPSTKITDITLDGCFVEEGNYYLLLEKKSCLTNLSLARCQIGDVVVGMIASRLVHPLPGSKLLALNLSTNRISDVGAKSISLALRTNMKLAYLNLADNMITDEGAGDILNSFLEFYLRPEEILAARQRNVNHIKERSLLVAKMMKELKGDLDLDKKGVKKRKPTAPVKKVKGLEREREGSLKNPSLSDFDAVFLEKAESMAMERLGPFKDPHSPDNIVRRDDVVFCKGNQTLCYLNLAYNNLSYPSAKKMFKVLKYQNEDKVPKGLVNVCLEGNPMPIVSREMTLIDEMLDSNLNTLCRRSLNLSQKKKPGKGVRA